MNELTFKLAKDYAQVYNEAYFGKNKNLLEMQMCIEKLRNKYPDYYKRKMSDVYHDHLFIKFRKLIEDEFGFSTVGIVIDNTAPEMLANLCTASVNGSFGVLNPAKDAIVNNYGIKYKKEMDYSIFIIISSHFLFNPQYLTSGEVIALVLHEIGHNFTYVLNKQLIPCRILTQCAAWITAMSNAARGGNIKSLIELLLFNTKPGLKITSQIATFDTKQNKSLTLLLDFVDTIINLTRPAVDAIFKIAEPCMMIENIPLMLSLINPVTFATITVGIYNDEKFADRFAAMYGYGEELASGLAKIQERGIDRKGAITHYISNCPIIGHLYALTMIMMKIAILPFVDPHPRTIARALSLTKMLEHDLNDPSIPDSLKIQIRKDLEKINKVIKEKSEYKNSDSIGIGAIRLYNQFLMRIFPDGDFRNVIDSYIFKSNDRINDIVNKIKNC